MTKVPASMRPEPFDPEYERLRQLWHATKDTDEHYAVNRELSDYVWRRAEKIVHADRAKHPKAKRNAPAYVREPEEPSTRVLP